MDGSTRALHWLSDENRWSEIDWDDFLAFREFMVPFRPLPGQVCETQGPLPCFPSTVLSSWHPPSLDRVPVSPGSHRSRSALPGQSNRNKLALGKSGNQGIWKCPANTSGCPPYSQRWRWCCSLCPRAPRSSACASPTDAGNWPTGQGFP
jgi:hypothetical protein